MTVCIASFGKISDNIVAACDRWLSFGDISADNAAVKFMAIGKRWMCMFAADDISPVIPIYESIRNRFADHDEGELSSIVSLISNSYIDELKLTRERAVLYQYGITMDEFATKSTKMADHLVQYLNAELSRLIFSVELLVFGHDRRNQPHIFTVVNPGIVSYHDTEGYAAIGAGAWAAKGSLMLSHNSAIRTQETVYEVCAAKLSAERTRMVGEQTYLFILNCEGQRKLMYDEVMRRARAIWETKQAMLRPSDQEVHDIEAAIALIPPDQNIL